MAVNLFTALFYLLLLLLLLTHSTLCRQVCASNVVAPPSPDSNTVELFKTEKQGQIKIKFKPGGEETTSKDEQIVNVKNYYSPVIVSEGDSFIVLVGVDRTVKLNEKHNIVTTYIQSETLFKKIEDVKSTKNDWETQYAVKNEAGKGTDEVVKGLLAVAKNNETYLLLVNFSKKAQTDSANTLDLKFGVVVRKLKDGVPAKKILIERNKI